MSDSYMMTEERQGRAGRWYDDWTDWTVLTTRSETKNEVQHAIKQTNSCLNRSQVLIAWRQLSKQKTMIACVNSITDYTQHVVVQYLISPVSQSVSRMSILWLHYVSRLAFTNIVYYDFVVFSATSKLCRCNARYCVIQVQTAQTVYAVHGK